MLLGRRELQVHLDIVHRVSLLTGSSFQASGRAPPSFISFCLEKIDENGDVAAQERIIQDTAAAMYIGKQATNPHFIDIPLISLYSWI